MGGSKKTTIGYHYRVAYHHGLCRGPIDAFLEFRAADKSAWTGLLSASGTITINAPNLFGGEKDQGGIAGDVDVQFGEAGQMPNSYLASVFGEQQSAWRGLATLAFKGGRYGAMNPYPQRASYLVRKIKKGWDEPGCWYPEKVQIPMLDGQVVLLGSGWEYRVETFSEPNTVWNDFAVPTSGWSVGGDLPFSTNGMSGGKYWTPTRSNIWLRRRMHVNAIGVTMHIAADNGCNVWVDGVLAGSSNPTNVPVADNTRNPVSYTFGTTGTVEVLVKAFAEQLAADEAGNSVRLAFSGLPLAAMNPAHLLFYARTNANMGREPAANINNASLQAAADWFHARGFGLCTSYDPGSETPADFEKRICKVAGCSFTRSLVDGQWYLDIANGEYTLADLPVLTDDDILDFKEIPSILDAAANSISIEYFDVPQKESVVTPPVIAQGLVAVFGAIHQSIDYPEIPTAELALRVAQRELLARVTPTRAFDLTTTRKPYAWRPGQYFRLRCPRRGIADMVCIVGEIQSGATRSGAIRLKAAQDVYSLPSSVYVQPESGVDASPSQVPVPVAIQRVIEAPYIEIVGTLPRAELQALPEDAGYLVAVAIDPAESRDYTLRVAPEGGESVDAGYGDWTPSALVVEPAGHLDAAFSIASTLGLDQISAGMPALWDDEIVRVAAIDPDAGTITLGRGCADTVPAPHAAGSRLWFFDAAAAVDQTEYTEAETVTARLLTNTASRQLAEFSATPLLLTFAARAARPYPPASVQINGMTYPDPATPVTTALALTWAHRDRVMQADQLVDTAAASIGPEPGTTYTVEYYTESGTTPLAAETDIAGGSSTPWLPPASGKYRIELCAVRDGLESWQRYVHTCTFGHEIVGTVGNAANLESYSAQLSLPGAVMWSIAAGSLPAGLHLDDSTGEIRGVPSDTTGYYAVTVRAEDASGGSALRELEIGLGNYSALLHLSGAPGGTAAIDQTGKVWTRTGSPVLSAAQAKFGEASMYFGGAASNWFFTTPNHSDFALGGGDWTMSAWVYMVAGDSNYRGILGKRAGSTSSASWGWGTQQDKGLYFQSSTTGSNSSGPGITDLNVTFGKGVWSYVDVTRRGNEMRSYRDGVLMRVDAVAGNIYNSSAAVMLGKLSSSGDGNSCWHGYMQEVGIIRGAGLSVDEFVPPSAPSDYPQPAAAIAINGSLPVGSSASSYSSTTDIRIHGTEPFMVSVTAGALPAGWAAVVNGAHVEIVGSGVASGEYTFTLTASDGTHSASLPLTVRITP